MLIKTLANNLKITLGITGATGIPIAFTLLKHLLDLDCHVHLIVTNAGVITVKQEMGISLSNNPNTTRQVLVDELKLNNAQNLYAYTNTDWYAPVASGSSVSDAMVICPCSMTTLAKVANGVSDDLLSRAADVGIKERKNLILVPRETPLSAIHLTNMQKLATLGACILPPMPAFYTHPSTIQDLIDFIVGRILDQLNLSNGLVKRWADK